MVKIDGYGDNLTVDGVRIGDLSPADHEKIEKQKQLNYYLDTR